ncbi:glutamate-5-semialdehyde dehydrogenase [Anaerovorax odorimutans]|uniref:Gamma-glutamyl phosphate reductase n=1 Tax=Anaerovorax odorimutans TaxID=109327 RepID=A0ABT1RJQ2_9FIRM|nr:glutamate-5-semialdehyde dehydrogenase [Anaerovorax odorimutans]MCQ4635389.1 glutamate-5-semialdehyde dehydrogenase [Anaerovorax odorimutans]
MDYKTLAANVKADSFKMAALPREVRDKALEAIIAALRANSKAIFDANARDLVKAAEDSLPAPIQNRLKFDEHKLSDCISGMEDLKAMEDPLFRQLLKRELDEGLTLIKTTCPIGVIGVIFESRPDALVQISALCIKSGNCAILKGGSEAANTNRILFDTIYKAGVSAGLPENFALLIEDRAGIDELLKCHESVDLIIPRGSNQFVQYIMANSKIPVMGHADGVCHVYVDEDADIEKAVPIVIDSKTQYVAACNAAETLLVNRKIAAEFLPGLAQASGTSIEYRGDETVCNLISCKKAEAEDFETEYLDYILSIKIVDSTDEAIDHINHYGSHHTDCIITENADTASRFMANVDSAGVYQNCSTRFADGFRYGFGAEVGISTGKLHARGPVGLDGLVTYKYKLFGSGQIVADYASGASQFHFKDLK